MDQESREAFSKLADKVDSVLIVMNKHMMESAVRDRDAIAGVPEAKTAIASHLDDPKEKRGWWAAIWTGLIVAMALSVWSLVTGKKQ